MLIVTLSDMTIETLKFLLINTNALDKFGIEKRIYFNKHYHFFLHQYAILTVKFQ